MVPWLGVSVSEEVSALGPLTVSIRKAGTTARRRNSSPIRSRTKTLRNKGWLIICFPMRVWGSLKLLVLIVKRLMSVLRKLVGIAKREVGLRYMIENEK